MSILDIHDRLGNTALFYTIALAAWGLWRFARKQGVDSNFWGAAVIAEVLYLVQGVLGMYIYFAALGHLERVFTHALYGVISVLVVPSVFAFTRGDGSRRTMLVYGLAFLFMVGVILRGQVTGV